MALELSGWRRTTGIRSRLMDGSSPAINYQLFFLGEDFVVRELEVLFLCL